MAAVRKRAVGVTKRMVGVLLLAGCSHAASPVDAPISQATTAAAAIPSALRPVAAVASPTAAAPPASSDPALQAWSREWTQALHAFASELARRDDGRSQLAAALLAGMSEDGDTDPGRETERRARVAALLARASELAPDDALVAWLERSYCPHGSAPCDPAQAAARLQRIEPDNAAVWLLALEDAYAAQDAAGIDRALARAAQSTRFDSAWGRHGEFLDAVLAQVPMPPRSPSLQQAQRRILGEPFSDEQLRQTYAVALSNAMALPAYLGLTRSCRDPIAQAGRRDACLALAMHMQGASTLVDRGIGFAVARHFVTGTPEQPLWSERRRELAWLRTRAANLRPQMPPGSMQAVWRDGEVATLQARLIASGLPLAPPAGWRESDG